MPLYGSTIADMAQAFHCLWLCRSSQSLSLSLQVCVPPNSNQSLKALEPRGERQIMGPDQAYGWHMCLTLRQDPFAASNTLLNTCSLSLSTVCHKIKK